MDFVVVGATPEQMAILQGRAKVVAKWCQDHGKDPDDLTFDEIKTIRSLPEWKNPVT